LQPLIPGGLALACTAAFGQDKAPSMAEVVPPAPPTGSIHIELPGRAVISFKSGYGLPACKIPEAVSAPNPFEH
jgi:hypothetical protein